VTLAVASSSRGTSIEIVVVALATLCGLWVTTNRGV